MTATLKPLSRSAAVAHAGDEEAIRRGHIPTNVSPRAARCLVWFFLLLVFGLPLSQAGIELSRGQRPRVLQFFSIFHQQEHEVMFDLHMHAPLPNQKELKRFEDDDLTGSSLARNAVQPWLQDQLTNPGGFGNSKAVVGVSDPLGPWLFYQPGIDDVAGFPVTDPGRLRAKLKKMLDGGEHDWHPDPRPAILQFHQDCAAAGIHLVLVPIPDKAGMQPAQLTSRLAGYAGPPLTNSGYDHLLADLRGAGVDVFDARPARIHAATFRYLRHDTHWTPEFMEQTARDLAAFIDQTCGSSLTAPRTTYRTRDQVVRNTGDIVAMLKLPSGQKRFQPETVTVHQVLDSSDQLWQPTTTSDILLLGDSFTNIYTADDMGWGSAAGLGPQLSRALARPLDLIARNGSGASMTRAELATRPNPLAGKKVIIWEFAMRELTADNWQVIPLDSRPQDPAATAPQNITLIGELLTAPPVVDPSTTPYEHAIVVLKFQVDRVLTGTYTNPEILVSLPFVRNRQLLAASSFQVGHKYQLSLSPSDPPETKYWQRLDRSRGARLPLMWAMEAREQ